MFDVRTIPGAEKLNTAFVAGGFSLRLVGGAVRDIILGETPKDFDFATDATPAEMRTVAADAGFGCIATGEQHGTMTIVVDGEVFEVTTLRIDVETDGRHAEVEFTRSFEEDAARRDLTFNAMSMDFDGNLFDYFDGQKDLQDRVVRFVGVARDRVEEDYLRILRYFRFMARFDARGDAAVFEMLLDPAIHEGLRKISVERFWLEMSKLFKAPAGAKVTLLMEGLGIIDTIGLPGFMNQDTFLKAGSDAARLSAFMPETFSPADAKAWCRSWKLSRDIIDEVVWLVRNRTTPVTIANMEDFIVDGVTDYWVINWVQMHFSGKDDDYQAICDRLVDFAHETPVFPVGGQDLIERGEKPGPDMGRKLKAMRDAWKRSRFVLTKDELLAEEV